MSWTLALITAAAVAPPTIDVIGTRPEARQLERPGRSVVLRPEDATRFDTSTLLRREASVTLPETGRVSASGFAVPRMRGQDARLTEIYVEDDLLQDPYSGLPLVDELDVRAFGELTYHLGTPPPELATVNPVGALRYRVRPADKNAVQTGATIGDVYGSSVWGIAQSRATAGDDEGLRGRLYVRQHQTRGRFRFHDDRGTPYNAADDRDAMRGNNDRRSVQALPNVSYRRGATTVSGFALLAESSQGLAARGRPDGGHARQSASGRLVTVKGEHGMHPQGTLFLSGSGRSDRRETEDPSQDVLGNRRQASIGVESRKVSAGGVWSDDATYAKLEIGRELSEVETQADHATELAVRRSALGAYAGFLVSPLTPWTVELKGRGVRFEDEVMDGSGDAVLGDKASERQTRSLAGSSLALGIALGRLSAHGQIARSLRPPSLLEEFGDGGRIRGNPTLGPETVRHGEFGVTYRAATWAQAGVTGFQDDVDDRIVLVPVLAEALRAKNLERTRIRGLEAQVESDFGRTRAAAGATWLQPHDLTGARKRLPGVAGRYASMTLEHDVAGMTLRGASRHQSDVYRDLANRIVVPAYWVHDVGIDRRIVLGERHLDLGLAVTNVTDVRALDVSAPGSPDNEGRTAYSDLDGYPLPGRQWRLSLAASF